MRIVGYVFFFVFCLFISAYRTFPWDAAKGKLVSAANAQGVGLEIDEIQPSWLTGVTAKGVRVDVGPGIALEELTVRAKVLSTLVGSPGVAVKTPFGGGEVKASVEMGDERFALDADISEVNLAAVGPLAEAGYPMSGILGLTADLQLSQNDATASNGKITVDIKGLSLAGGAKLGPVSLPEDQGLTIGDIAFDVPITDGIADLKGIRITGTDVDLTIDGKIELSTDLGRSKFRSMAVGAKPKGSLLELIGPFLTMAKKYRNSDGFYNLAIAGTLSKPKPFPKR